MSRRADDNRRLSYCQKGLQLVQNILFDWLKTRHFLNQSEAQPKPIATCGIAHTRFPTRGAGYMYLLSSDWFIGLSASVVIGQSNYFGLGFTIH